MPENMHLNYDFEDILEQLPNIFQDNDLLNLLTISDEEAIKICGGIPTASIDMGRVLHMLDVVDVLKDLKLIREDFNASTVRYIKSRTLVAKAAKQDKCYKL